jgi:hypothetical protein
MIPAFSLIHWVAPARRRISKKEADHDSNHALGFHRLFGVAVHVAGVSPKLINHAQWSTPHPKRFWMSWSLRRTSRSTSRNHRGRDLGQTVREREQPISVSPDISITGIVVGHGPTSRWLDKIQVLIHPQRRGQLECCPRFNSTS